jgi:hypothetical protein
MHAHLMAGNFFRRRIPLLDGELVEKVARQIDLAGNFS